MTEMARPKRPPACVCVGVRMKDMCVVVCVHQLMMCGHVSGCFHHSGYEDGEGGGKEIIKQRPHARRCDLCCQTYCSCSSEK